MDNADKVTRNQEHYGNEGKRKSLRKKERIHQKAEVLELSQPLTGMGTILNSASGADKIKRQHAPRRMEGKKAIVKESKNPKKRA